VGEEGGKTDFEGLLFHSPKKKRTQKVKIGPNSDLKLNRKFNESEEDEKNFFRKMLFCQKFEFFHFLSLLTSL
jgi:hypothetical protein